MGPIGHGGAGLSLSDLIVVFVCPFVRSIERFVDFSKEKFMADRAISPAVRTRLTCGVNWVFSSHSLDIIVAILQNK